MKILYHHRTQGTGAEGVHIAYVIKGLRGHGHVVTVLAPNDVDPLNTAGDNPFGKRRGLRRRLLHAISRAAPQWAFEAMEFGYNVPAYLRLRRELQARPEMIYERHAFFLGAGAYLAGRTATPYVVEVNEVAGHERVRGQVFVKAAQRIERFVFDRADAIVVVSDFLKQQIADMGVAGDKIHVLPNGVDETLFSPDVDRREVRQRFGFSEDTVVVGFVGWFVAWHNLPLLIDAFADVMRRETDRGSRPANACLFFVGDGTLKEELQRHADARGVGDKIVFPGAVRYDDMPRYINAMDICVIPGSNAYRSPIKLFEYMVMGKAVIAPNHRPIAQILEDGKEGLLFSPDDREGLGQALASLVNSSEKRNELGGNARRKVLDKHLWRHVAGRIISIYDSIRV